MISATLWDKDISVVSPAVGFFRFLISLFFLNPAVPEPAAFFRMTGSQNARLSGFFLLLRMDPRFLLPLDLLRICLWHQFSAEVFLQPPAFLLDRLPQLPVSSAFILQSSSSISFLSYVRRRYHGYLWKSSPGMSPHCSDLAHHLPGSVSVTGFASSYFLRCFLLP